MPFNIIICGAGLGGLGAAIALKKNGHTITILEGAPQLGEVGAGIQIPPNSCRVLDSYGVTEGLKKVVAWPQNISFKRYATGEGIGTTPLDPTMTEKYGYPYWLIHRADYHMGLLHRAEELSIDIQLNSLVLKVDDDASSKPTVTLSDGRKLTADIIIGADGIRSKVRESILGSEDVRPQPSSNCAYRATVPGRVMRSDPKIAHLMDDINANCWIGPGRHIMAYPIRSGELYNLVMSHPASLPADKWSEPGSLKDMRAQYKTFDPTIQRVLTKVESCLKWKLADIPPLPRWVSNTGGRVVLIGDAAHAMLPYLAQGAATSIEDGAALAECIARASSKDEIPAVLRAFVSIRKPRTEIIQARSRENGDIWHLPDGVGQEKRDAAMAGNVTGHVNGGGEQNPNRWADQNFQPWLFGYDTFKETNLHLDEELKAQGGALGRL